MELDVEDSWVELDVEGDWTELELGVDDAWPEVVTEPVVDDMSLGLTLDAEDDVLDETEVDVLDGVETLDEDDA